MRILKSAATAVFLSFAIAAPVALAPVNMATASTAEASRVLIDKMGADILKIYKDKEITKQDKANAFAKLFEAHFDLNPVARFVLGRYWRVATPDEKAEFTKQFHAYIVKTYSARMGSYSGQEFEVVGARDLSKREAIVKSEVRSPDGRIFKVDWRLLTRDGKTRVTDLIIEGVSLAVTHRSEFAAVINRGGGKVATLIEQLKNQNAK